MAVSSGTAYFRGKSGQSYIKDLYVTDTAGGLFGWDGGVGASATSPDNWRPPEDVTLVGYNQLAATGQTRTAIDINLQYTGNMIRNSQHIPSATIIGLPYIGVSCPAGQKITLRAVA